MLLPKPGFINRWFSLFLRDKRLITQPRLRCPGGSCRQEAAGAELGSHILQVAGQGMGLPWASVGPTVLSEGPVSVSVQSSHHATLHQMP